jgi:hypothetical protein
MAMMEIGAAPGSSLRYVARKTAAKKPFGANGRIAAPRQLTYRWRR